jgi:hypothetical protein
MSNRRQFLKNAASTAGVMFTGCHLLSQKAYTQTAAPRRRQVTVGGRRVTTIDVHAHVIIPEAWALMGLKLEPADPSVIDGATASARFRTMDEWGTDMQALSINPNWYTLKRDLASRVIDLQNEKLAALCAKYPDASSPSPQWPCNIPTSRHSS